MDRAAGIGETPTIWPRAFIARALVLMAPGTSIVSEDALVQCQRAFGAK
jgi:hypothetical protein